MDCPECDTGELIRFGSRKQVNFKCNSCYRVFSEERLKELEVL